MSNKFIPNRGADFMRMARNFATQMSKDPARFDTAAEEVRQIADAVAEFERAFNTHNNRSLRSESTKLTKDQARARATELIRQAARRIRENKKVSDADRVLVGIYPKTARGERPRCPQSAPFLYLTTYRGMHMTTPGIHVLRFTDSASTAAKPEGAVRLELFAGFLEPGGAVPSRPRPLGMGYHGYLRSYTRSPIRVEYPLADKPMQVLYWGRWANSAGETGPFSQTLVAPIDGRDWSRYSLPEPEDQLSTRVRSTVIVTSARPILPGAEPMPDAA